MIIQLFVEGLFIASLLGVVATTLIIKMTEIFKDGN